MADPYKHKRHRFYAEPWIAEGLDELARLNRIAGRKGKTRSELLENAGKDILRRNSKRLSKAGFTVPV